MVTRKGKLVICLAQCRKMKRYLEGIRTSHGSSHESRETAKKNILRDKQMYAHQEMFEGKQMSKEKNAFFLSLQCHLFIL